MLAALLFQRRKARVDARPVDLLELAHVAEHEIERHRRGQAAQRRENAGPDRHAHVADAEALCDIAHVGRSRATECQQREIPEIDALLGGVDRGRVRHVVVHDFIDAARGTDGVDAEWLGDVLLDGRGCPLWVEPHLAAEEIVGVEVAEQQVGIGDRRRRAACPVAGRPGIGARAVGTDAQQAQRVDPGDAAAAGTDLDEVDRRAP